MSKRLGNIIDPNTVIPRYGADAARLFLTTSSQLWTPRRFDEAGIRDTARRLRRPLKDACAGIFPGYPNFGWAAPGKEPAPGRPPPRGRRRLPRPGSAPGPPN